jgi:hypothetical protein
MHPYVIEEMVRERRGELSRLAAVDRRVTRERVRPWRGVAGRALASLAVAVSVPRTQRTPVRQHVVAALRLEHPC